MSSLHTGQGLCGVRAEDCPLDLAYGGSWLWKAFSSLESNVAALWRRAEAQFWLLQRQGVSSPLDSLKQREALLHNLVAVCLD